MRDFNVVLLIYVVLFPHGATSFDWFSILDLHLHSSLRLMQEVAIGRTGYIKYVPLCDP